MNFTDSEIEDLLKGIFAGDITKENLPVDLYQSIAEFLEKGLLKGAGGPVTSFDGKDLDLIQELRTNIYMFSAAKTYQEVRTMTDLLYNEDDKVKPFDEFFDDARAIYNNYNVNYAQTEYNTAVASGQMGIRWNQIEADKEILPLLKMTVVEDAQTTEICEPLDGITLPVNDPFWDEFYPPNHWNCRSTVLQLDEGEISSKAEVDKAKEHADEDMQDVFKMNVGKDEIVFSPDHPYFKVPREDQDLAKRNFDLPMPADIVEFISAKTTREAEDWAKENLGVKYVNYKGIDVKVANDINRGVQKTKRIMPEIEIPGLGSAQKANKEIKDIVKQAYKNSDFYQTIIKTYGEKSADRSALAFANRHVQKVGQNTLAWSSNIDKITIPGGEKIDLSRYRGVFVSEKAGKSKELLDEIIIANEKQGWFTKGAKDFEYIMNHELGHEVDKFLGIRNDADFLKIYERERALGEKSIAEKLSTYGATAGGRASDKPFEFIAESWAEFTSSPNPRPIAKEMGELMMKKYHEKAKIEIPFKEWFKESLKILK